SLNTASRVLNFQAKLISDRQAQQLGPRATRARSPSGRNQPGHPTRSPRQIQTNPVGRFGELPGGNPNPLATLCIAAGIVWRTASASGAVERGELRRAYAPVAALLPRHDVEMEMRRFLPAVDPVVLERQYPERPVSRDERLGDPLGCDQDSRAFLRREIEQGRDVPARDDAALTDFELPRIDHGEREFAFVDDRPAFFATGHSLAQVAGISHGKLDQLLSPQAAAGRIEECLEYPPGSNAGAGRLPRRRRLTPGLTSA
ncbi:MAG TPA: hypothetical protein VM847_00065, partial [Tahibacter sp.]|nr:hypothetical protein [Tahibacter sp.]